MNHTSGSYSNHPVKALIERTQSEILVLFTANWISLRVELFYKYGLGCYYIACGCLITGLEYGIWNGRILLSKLVLLCKNVSDTYIPQ